MTNKSRASFAFALAIAAIAFNPLPVLASPQQAIDQAQARVFLDQGVEAYKNAHFDAAIEDFKAAKRLDPSLTNASLYLATTYASQYIPGAPAEENLELGRHAMEEYRGILERDPHNLSAIDGLGGILYSMASTPFDPEKMNEAKSYHQRHIEIRPNDPEPYYWIGVIDWSICYKTSQGLRETWAKANPNASLAPADPLPEVARQDFVTKCGDNVDEGIAQVKKAISLKPDYDDAMAYLNLLYRLKADMETSTEAREADIRTANALVDQVIKIKQKRAGAQNPR